MSPYTVSHTTRPFGQLGCIAKLQPNALRVMQGGSLYHFYDGFWYDLDILWNINLKIDYNIALIGVIVFLGFALRCLHVKVFDIVIKLCLYNYLMIKIRDITSYYTFSKIFYEISTYEYGL